MVPGLKTLQSVFWTWTSISKTHTWNSSSHYSASSVSCQQLCQFPLSRGQAAAVGLLSLPKSVQLAGALPWTAAAPALPHALSCASLSCSAAGTRLCLVCLMSLNTEQGERQCLASGFGFSSLWALGCHLSARVLRLSSSNWSIISKQQSDFSPFLYARNTIWNYRELDTFWSYKLKQLHAKNNRRAAQIAFYLLCSNRFVLSVSEQKIVSISKLRLVIIPRVTCIFFLVEKKNTTWASGTHPCCVLHFYLHWRMLQMLLDSVIPLLCLYFLEVCCRNSWL